MTKLCNNYDRIQCDTMLRTILLRWSMIIYLPYSISDHQNYAFHLVIRVYSLQGFMSDHDNHALHSDQSIDTWQTNICHPPSLPAEPLVSAHTQDVFSKQNCKKWPMLLFWALYGSSWGDQFGWKKLLMFSPFTCQNNFPDCQNDFPTCNNIFTTAVEIMFSLAK